MQGGNVIFKTLRNLSFVKWVWSSRGAKSVPVAANDSPDGITSHRRYGSLKICATAQRAVTALQRRPAMKNHILPYDIGFEPTGKLTLLK